MLDNPNNPPKRDYQLWRLPKVKENSALSRSLIYELMSRGEFPQSFKIADRAVAWRASEVREWCQKKIEKAGQ